MSQSRRSCQTSDQRDINNGAGPQICFVQIKKVALGGAKGDLICKFQFPVRSIWIASKDSAHLTDSLFLHFIPLGNKYAGNSITPTGGEPWIDMTYSAAAGQTYNGKFLKFSAPVSQVYFDCGQEAGGGDYVFTVAGSNDVEIMTTTGAGCTAS